MSLTTFDFQELLKIQNEHLDIWKERLKPALFAEVKEYAKSMNDESLGRVYRGQDLVEIIRTWPNLSPAYPRADVI